MEKFLKRIKKKLLSEEEKAKMWQHIEKNLSHERHTTPFAALAHVFTIHKKALVSLALIVVIVLGAGGGTIAFADAATPVDFLYPIDRAAENIRLAFSSNEKRKELRVQYALERIYEVEHVLALATPEEGGSDGVGPPGEKKFEIKAKNLKHSEEALSIALAYIEEQKQISEEEGNMQVALALGVVLGRLSEIAEKHVSDLDEVEVEIETKDNGKNVKAEIKLASKNIKIKFKLESKKNRTKITFESEKKEDRKKNNYDDEDKDDAYDADAYEGNVGRVTAKLAICHKGKNTITIAEPALFAHIKHGDTVGSCGGGDPNPEPEPDTTPPVISDIQADAATSSVAVSWNTNEDTTGEVFISTSTPATEGNAFSSKESTTLAASHEVMFGNLSPETTYYVFVIAEDGEGNSATSTEVSFATEALPDTTPPIISSLSATGLASTTATISFVTDEPATSNLWMSTSTPVDVSGGANQNIATATTTHAFFLSALNASTTYYYVVDATDESANTSTSTEETFTTTE